jgi:hypothetical protein
MGDSPSGRRQILLIVTNREDLAVDFMITKLRERNFPYFRLNCEELASARVDVRLGAQAAMRLIEIAGTSVDLETVGCVWFRRAIRPQALSTTAPEFRAFAAAELRHLFEGIVADPAVRWVNRYEVSELAERKPYQLRLAAGCGLLIPSTLISNDPVALAEFTNSHSRTICKPLSQGLVELNREWYAVHTREVQAAAFEHPDGLGGVPVMVQQLVPRGVDIRLTIIGADIYPVEVITPADSPIDWRAVGEGVSYRICEVPAVVEQGCRTLMAQLGITYGAFDFIRTDSGEWYFLEVNPAGEWAWLEVALGLPMRESFLSLFYGI